MILSYASLEFVGTEELPVVLRSVSGSGQGLVVIGAEETSILENARFENLSAPSRDGWQITGAVTFYESPLAATGCRFLASRSEDAMNIVRSPFAVSESLFRDSAFDALDLDSSNGTISATAFLESGNDAIDVSQSAVRLEDVLVNGVGDKGLSAGENSRVTAEGLRILNATLAVASKDRSTVTMKRVSIKDSKIGFAAFRKKPEYGAGWITVSDLTLEAVERPYLVERGSRVVVDGVPVAADVEKVEALLYGAE